jgi:hypothetical protein
MKKSFIFLIFGIVLVFGVFLFSLFPEHTTIIKEILPIKLNGLRMP